MDTVEWLGCMPSELWRRIPGTVTFLYQSPTRFWWSDVRWAKTASSSVQCAALCKWVQQSSFLTLRVRSFGVIRVRISDSRSVWIVVHQRSRRVRSFGVIRVRITDPRSVWIMGHQRNRRIHSGHGFAGSFDAPWSRQILGHWSELGSPQRNAPLYFACTLLCTHA